MRKVKWWKMFGGRLFVKGEMGIEEKREGGWLTVDFIG